MANGVVLPLYVELCLLDEIFLRKLPPTVKGKGPIKTKTVELVKWNF